MNSRNFHCRGKKAGSLPFAIKETSKSLESLQRDLKRIKETFASELRKDEWLVNTLTKDLEIKRQGLNPSLQSLLDKASKSEIADKLSRWVDFYSRRTLSEEPVLARTMKDVIEQTDRVETYVLKEDQFTFVYVLLAGLLLGALVVCRRMRQVTKFKDT